MIQDDQLIKETELARDSLANINARMQHVTQAVAEMSSFLMHWSGLPRPPKVRWRVKKRRYARARRMAHRAQQRMKDLGICKFNLQALRLLRGVLGDDFEIPTTADGASKVHAELAKHMFRLAFDGKRLYLRKVGPSTWRFPPDEEALRGLFFS